MVQFGELEKSNASRKLTDIKTTITQLITMQEALKKYLHQFATDPELFETV